MRGLGVGDRLRRPGSGLANDGPRPSIPGGLYVIVRPCAPSPGGLVVEPATGVGARPGCWPSPRRRIRIYIRRADRFRLRQHLCLRRSASVRLARSPSRARRRSRWPMSGCPALAPSDRRRSVVPSPSRSPTCSHNRLRCGDDPGAAGLSLGAMECRQRGPWQVVSMRRLAANRAIQKSSLCQLGWRCSMIGICPNRTDYHKGIINAADFVKIIGDAIRAAVDAALAALARGHQ